MKIVAFLFALWMEFSRLLSKLSTLFLLTLIFIIVIGPISILSKLLKKDFLRLKKIYPTNWQQSTQSTEKKRYYHQF